MYKGTQFGQPSSEIVKAGGSSAEIVQAAGAMTYTTPGGSPGGAYVEVVVQVVGADGVVRGKQKTAARLSWTDDGQVDWDALNNEQKEACLRQIASSYAGAVRMALGLAKDGAAAVLEQLAVRLMRETHGHRMLK